MNLFFNEYQILMFLIISMIFLTISQYLLVIRGKKGKNNDSSADLPYFFSKFTSKKSESYNISKMILKDKIKFILKKYEPIIELLYFDEINDRIYVELHLGGIKYGRLNEIGKMELKIDEIEKNKSRLTYYILLFRDFRYTIFLLFFLAMELPVIIVHLITFLIDLQNYMLTTTLKYLQGLPVFVIFHVIFIIFIPIIQLSMRAYANKKFNKSIKWLRQYLKEEVNKDFLS